MDEFIVKIKPLTPLWTGDENRKNTRLRETGIIGSLRWWYEALIRGLGGTACDPTSEDKCSLNQRQFQKAILSGRSVQEALSEQKICPACELFGCTGWARKFRLEVEFNENFPLFFTTSLRTNKWWLEKIFDIQKSNKQVLWLKDSYIDLKFTPIRDSNGMSEEIIKSLLYIIGNYGGLGAKLQYGFGQIQINNVNKDTAKRGLKYIKHNISTMSNKSHNNSVNDFEKFFSLKLKIPQDNTIIQHYIESGIIIGEQPDDWDHEFIPCAFDIKYRGEVDEKENKGGNGKEFGLRKYFKDKFNKNTAKEIFGYSGDRDERKGGNIFVSSLYKEPNENNYYFLKVFGFLKDSNHLDTIKEHITNIFDISASAETCEIKTGKDILED